MMSKRNEATFNEIINNYLSASNAGDGINISPLIYNGTGINSTSSVWSSEIKSSINTEGKIGIGIDEKKLLKELLDSDNPEIEENVNLALKYLLIKLEKITESDQPITDYIDNEVKLAISKEIMLIRDELVGLHQEIQETKDTLRKIKESIINSIGY